jgi:hypothetical protein
MRIIHYLHKLLEFEKQMSVHQCLAIRKEIMMNSSIGTSYVSTNLITDSNGSFGWNFEE